MAKQISDAELAEATGMTLVEEQPKDEKKPDDQSSSSDGSKEEKKEEKPDDQKKTEEKPEEKKPDESVKKDAEEEKKPTEEEKKDEKKEENPQDTATRFNELIASELKEFEVESVEELKEILEGVEAMAETIDKLQKAKKEPEFQSEAQRKAYEFITSMGYDPSRYGEGLQAHAKVVSMDLEKADPIQMVEEKYILEHPELTREEALRRFAKKERSKYVVNKEDFEDDEKFKEAQDDARIELKSEAAKSKAYLQKQQEQFKAPVKEEKKEEVKVTPRIQTAIKDTVAEFKSYGEGLETLTFEDDKNPDNKFSFKLTKEDRKRILEAGTRYLSRPEIYNEKGEIPEHNVEKYFENYAFAIRGREIVEASLKHAHRMAEIIKVDDVAKKKPDYKGGKESGAIENLDPMAQAEIQANKNVEDRKRGVRR